MMAMSHAPCEDAWQPSDGEIHFLYWYMQGSIMVPETRWRLRRAWGMCERHAWGALAVETSYRPTFLHGPAVLYEDIVGRAARTFQGAGPLQALRVARRLRPTGPCMMCEMGYGPGMPAAAAQDIIERGRDFGQLRALAVRTEPHWCWAVCGVCSGDGVAPRCRRHLREAAKGRTLDDLPAQRRLVEAILNDLSIYSKSFVWGNHHLQSDAGRAALISAVGWCSGWRPLMALLE